MCAASPFFFFFKHFSQNYSLTITTLTATAACTAPFHSVNLLSVTALAPFPLVWLNFLFSLV